MSSQTTCQGSQSLGGIRKAFKIFERFVCPPDTDTHRTAGGREGNDSTEQGRAEPANFQFYGFLVGSRDQAGPLHSSKFKMLLRQLSYDIKTQLKALKVPIVSFWHKAGFHDQKECINYFVPTPRVGGFGCLDLCPCGIRELASATYCESWSPFRSSSGPFCWDRKCKFTILS